MEMLIPFMMFILDLEGETPQLTRHPAVYRDEQECQAAGTQMMLERYGTVGETRFWCMALPGEEEFDAMMQRVEADHVARREAREAERARPEPRRKP